MLCADQADDGLEQELQLVDTCRKRLEHLSEYATEGRLAMPAVQAWKRKRMDRMLVDHCLRSGFYDTAVQLAKDANIEVSRLIVLTNCFFAIFCVIVLL